MTKKDPEEKRRKRERKQARSAALGFDGGEMAGTPEIANPNTAVLRRSRSALLLGAVAGAILIGLASYALLTRNIQATRDAYVAGNVVPVTAQEAGTVIAIGADDTQAVKAGDTLVTLDSTLANVPSLQAPCGKWAMPPAKAMAGPANWAAQNTAGPKPPLPMQPATPRCLPPLPTSGSRRSSRLIYG